jgi:hypothetical protein
MTRHKHADLIIQSVQDTTIEWQCRFPKQIWHDTLQPWPEWSQFMEYRQKPELHPHQLMIDEAQDDPSIEWQVLSEDGVTWLAAHYPMWHYHCHYQRKLNTHIHQVMIDQAAADPSIKWQHRLRDADIRRGDEWYNCSDEDPISWYITREYRQKPAQAVTIDMWQWALRIKGSVIYACDEYFETAEQLLVSRPGFEIVARIEGSKITIPVKS